MKKFIIITCFIASFVMCNKQVEKPSENELQDSELVGIWTSESKLVDSLGQLAPYYSGYFMIVHSDGSYKMFDYNNMNGGNLTSEGTMVVESDDILIEHIKHHTYSSLIGKSNRIEYKIENDRFYKTFSVENDIYHETWRRVRMP